MTSSILMLIDAVKRSFAFVPGRAEFSTNSLAAGCVRETELCNALTASVIKQVQSAATQHSGFQLARVAASTIISLVRHTHTC
jgi:hypothetical protein